MGRNGEDSALAAVCDSTSEATEESSIESSAWIEAVRSVPLVGLLAQGLHSSLFCRSEMATSFRAVQYK